MARMSSLRHLSIALLYYSAAVLLSLTVNAQTLTPDGGETAFLESNAVRGDQVLPDLSINSSGGYLVWQDNAIDGSGFGIGARWVDASLNPGVFGSFRVNQIAANDQMHPRVATFSSGAAAFVWQGGPPTNQNIFIRFLNPNRTFANATDIRVNTYTADAQRDPGVTVLNNSQVAVAWSSSGQDGSMQGIFARIVNTNGQFATAPFQVNQYTNFNQRSAAITTLSDGRFVVLWVSEQRPAGTPDQSFGGRYVDVMCRLFSANGQPVSNEFRINTTNGVCANPSVAASPTGGFTAAWSQKIFQDPASMEIWVATVNADGTLQSAPTVVNETSYGDQYNPSLGAISNSVLVTWTSLGQDGSLEGIYGRLLYAGVPSGSEFLVNTTTLNQQVNSVVGSDGNGRFLSCWAGFVGGSNRFDIFGQHYGSGQPLPVPAAPFVAALRFDKLSVTWAPLSGYPLSYYELYMDGAVPPAATARITNSTYYVKSGLDPQTFHSFRLAYVFQGGLRSQLSAEGTNTTWADDLTGRDGIPDGIPDDWEKLYFGYKAAEWPRAGDDSDGDGVSNYREFLAGTNPMDPNSVLRFWFTWTRFGKRLNWNTQVGFVYQVQVSSDLVTWNPFGAPRFAAGTTDSAALSGTAAAEYYRVVRVR